MLEGVPLRALSIFGLQYERYLSDLIILGVTTLGHLRGLKVMIRITETL